MAWLLVGVGVLLAGLIWILGLTQVIVAPVIAASVIAAVASPLVAWLARHRVPEVARRPSSSCSLIVAAGVGMTVMVITGITGQSGRHHLRSSTAPRTRSPAGSRTSGLDPSKADAGQGGRKQRGQRQRRRPPQRARDRDREALLARLLPRADRAQPLLPAHRRAQDPRLGRRPHRACRRRSAQMITQRVLQSLRGYFLGVTIVAAFNAVVVTLGAVDPRRAAGRDDRRGHLHRRLRPLPRRLGRRRLRGPDRARRRRAPMPPPG